MVKIGVKKMVRPIFAQGPKLANTDITAFPEDIGLMLSSKSSKSALAERGKKKDII